MPSDPEEGAAHPEGVRALYEVLLGRTATDADLACWAGVPTRTVGEAIISSQEYRVRAEGFLRGGSPDAVPALRLLATGGMADLSPRPAIAPSQCLSAVPFDAIDDQLTAPSIRIIGGFAAELGDELRRRGHNAVTLGLADAPDAAQVLVTTGPSDLDVLSQVRPEIVAAARRVLVPCDVSMEDFPLDAQGVISKARGALHRLGFAEVLRIFRVPQGGPTITVDVSDLVPPSGVHAVRVVTEVESPRSTWMVGNRVPFAEEL